MAQGQLLLEDGTSYNGTIFGADKSVQGEVVFSTGMVGYPEALTDPSYRGQILVLTYPLVGNYGVGGNNSQMFESEKIQVRGLVVANYIDSYSHWQATRSLDKWLKSQGTAALSGIDTRSLTIKLRQKGTMLGILQAGNNKNHKFINPNKENLISEVSVKKPKTIGRGKKRIALIDCGVKKGIIDNLVNRKTTVIQLPYNFDPLKNNLDFDGVVISNGPGDPKMAGETVSIVQKLLNKKIPILGICLGNQILALAAGGNTYKLKYGHRSQNQPVALVGSQRCFLTTQNHGFVVDTNTLNTNWQVWFTNLNDNTNEGIRHKKQPFFAVQFHPEGKPGPDDTNWVFDEFLRSLNR